MYKILRFPLKWLDTKKRAAYDMAHQFVAQKIATLFTVDPCV
jgi:hypothetical protein